METRHEKGGARESAETRTRRRQRGKSADSIADIGLAVADRYGLDGVTIRAVAKAASVSPMGLYTYFARKDLSTMRCSPV
jgi:AcrR family transcriptional regulator